MTRTTEQTNEIRLSVMGEKIKNIEKDIGEIKTSINEIVTKIDNTYVTKEELRPIKAITYGMVGAILMAVLGVLMNLALA